MSKSPEQLAKEAEQAERAASLMGHNARALLDNPAWAPTWAFLRNGILEGWASLDAKDIETAQLLQLQVKVLDKLKRQFEELVAAGAAADADMRRRLEEQQLREEQSNANIFVRGVRNLRSRHSS